MEIKTRIEVVARGNVQWKDNNWFRLKGRRYRDRVKFTRIPVHICVRVYTCGRVYECLCVRTRELIWFRNGRMTSLRRLEIWFSRPANKIQTISLHFADRPFERVDIAKFVSRLRQAKSSALVIKKKYFYAPPPPFYKLLLNNTSRIHNTKRERSTSTNIQSYCVFFGGGGRRVPHNFDKSSLYI